MTRYSKKSIGYNFIMNFILTVSSFIFPMFTFPYVSRLLLPEGTGKVSFATSVISYFLIIAQLGIPTYGIRACAKVRDRKEELNQTVQEILGINLFMCVVAYIIFFVALAIVPKFQEERILLMVMSSSIFFYSIGVEWLYKALEMYSYITWRSILFKFIALLGVFLLVRNQDDYIIYGALTIFAASASYACNFINLRKYVSLRKKCKYQLKRHLKPILVFFAMSCATTIYLNLDAVMLGFLQSDVEVGYYDAAVKVRYILVSLVTSLGTVLLPRVTYYIEYGEKEKFYQIAQKAIRFVLLMAIPLCVYFSMFAEPVILVLSGEAYVNAVPAMQVLMPTIVFIGMTNIMGIQILVPLGKESKVLVSVIAGAIVDLVINVLLIPKYAAVGAAIGTLTAEVVVFIVQFGMDRKLFTQIYQNVHWVKGIVATIIAIAVATFLKGYAGTGIVLLIVTASVFGVVYVGVLLLLKEDLVIEILEKLANEKEDVIIERKVKYDKKSTKEQDK